jgi:hypothetical protein
VIPRWRICQDVVHVTVIDGAPDSARDSILPHVNSSRRSLCIVCITLRVILELVMVPDRGCRCACMNRLGL